MNYISTVLFLCATPAIAGYGDELRAIAMVESQNGKYLNHATVKRGPHKDTRAGGAFGLMPRTVKELIAESGHLYRKYGRWVFASDDALTERLNSDREMDREIAIYMWKKLRITMNAEKAACSWFWGPSHSKCSGENYRDTKYVEKFRRYLESL